MLGRLVSLRTRIGFLISGRFHSPFVCLRGAMAKLAVGVCVDVCGGECMHGCFVFGCVDVDSVGGDDAFEFL